MKLNRADHAHLWQIAELILKKLEIDGIKDEAVLLVLAYAIVEQCKDSTLESVCGFTYQITAYFEDNYVK